MSRFVAQLSFIYLFIYLFIDIPLLTNAKQKLTASVARMMPQSRDGIPKMMAS